MTVSNKLLNKIFDLNLNNFFQAPVVSVSDSLPPLNEENSEVPIEDVTNKNETGANSIVDDTNVTNNDNDVEEDKHNANEIDTLESKTTDNDNVNGGEIDIVAPKSEEVIKTKKRKPKQK